jgi:hypothetical protein
MRNLQPRIRRHIVYVLGTGAPSIEDRVARAYLGWSRGWSGRLVGLRVYIGRDEGIFLIEYYVNQGEHRSVGRLVRW